MTAPFQIFGLQIPTFEVLTTVGITIGIRYALNKAKSRNLDEKSMIDAILLSIFFGFVGAHIMHVLVYERDFSHPIKLIQIWKGISSTGGFLGGGIACWLYVKYKKLSVYDFGDCLITGLLLAQFFGRLGCFSVHDHPGALTTFALAVAFPDGTRHDLGLYEAILLFVFLITIHVEKTKQWLNQSSGRWMIAGLMFYGSIRFFLDFLRAQDLPSSDPRYAGLTPAQYVSLGFVFLSFVLIYRRKSTNVGDLRHS